mmetsp:Transcript_2556/g.6773  ORF Transcript_2556/g.6773 Transcript_2556/m.6773 type:complete len:254 (+) Transcript_2556:3-764(+)
MEHVALPPVENPEKPRSVIGLLFLPTDHAVDGELGFLFSQFPGVQIRFQHLQQPNFTGVDVDTYLKTKDAITVTAANLQPQTLTGLALACTSMAFTLGLDVVDDLCRAAHPQASITNMARATIKAFEALGHKDIAVLTPYIDELNANVSRTLAEHGFIIHKMGGMGLQQDPDITAVPQDHILACAKLVDSPKAKAFFVSCSALRVCKDGFIDTLEKELGKPVITSNQATAWHLLRITGVEDRVSGFGTLFREH